MRPRPNIKQRQALRARADGTGYPCPVPSCDKVLESPGGLGGHVSSHTEQEREAVRAAKARAGSRPV